MKYKQKKKLKFIPLRLAIFTIKDIFSHIRTNKENNTNIPFLYNGREVSFRRMLIFYELGIKCIKCGIEGKFFALEEWADGSWHMDLYGYDADNKEILMTIDHIYPKSKGGQNSINNYQIMDRICNRDKGDKILD